MHTFIVSLVVAFVAVGLLLAAVPAGQPDNPGLGRIRHVVIFKFKDSATKEQVAEIEKAFAGLAAKIPLIRDFEWGTNVSPENLAQGFTHCFLVTFDNEKARDEYLPHPAHKDFVKLLGPVLDKVLVVDYKAQR